MAAFEDMPLSFLLVTHRWDYTEIGLVLADDETMPATHVDERLLLKLRFKDAQLIEKGNYFKEREGAD